MGRGTGGGFRPAWWPTKFGRDSQLDEPTRLYLLGLFSATPALGERTNTLKLALVSKPFPKCDLAAHQPEFEDVAILALAIHRAQLDWCDVEPVATLGREVGTKQLNAAAFGS